MKLLVLSALSILLVSCGGKNANVHLRGNNVQKSAVLGTTNIQPEGIDDERKKNRSRRDRNRTEETAPRETIEPQNRTPICNASVPKSFNYDLDGGSGRKYHRQVVADEVVIDREEDKRDIEKRSGLEVVSMVYTIEGSFCDDGHLEDFGVDTIEGNTYSMSGESIAALLKVRLKVKMSDGTECFLRGRD